MSDARLFSDGLGESHEEARKPRHTFKAQFAIDGGHCPCDVHGGPTCDYCREQVLKLRAQRVCRCGRLLLRAGDSDCPVCDPSVWTVKAFGRV